MAQDTDVQNLVINTLTKTQFEAIENPSDTELWLVEETDTEFAKDATVVHNTGNETINGTKTFTNVILNSGTAQTVATSDNSNNIATTAYVQNVIASLVARIETLEAQLGA